MDYNKPNYFDELLKPKSKLKKNEKIDSDLVDNLFQKPKKDRGLNMPHFQRLSPNFAQQADLLFLPNDKGFRYALVIADQGSRFTDAEPLKSRSNEDVLKAFKTIYKRKILEKPKLLTVDPGTEFQGSTRLGLENMGIHFKVGKVQRHRQVAIVERRNQSIGYLIHKRITAEEIATDRASSSWVEVLPLIVKAINNRIKENAKKLPKPKNEPVCSGDSCNLLDVGDKVRVVLEAPESVLNGTRLHGKFRASDVRWDRVTREISKVILKPDFPPLYLLNNDKNTAYTKNQLQLVSKNEKTFKQKPTEDRYEVQKLLDRKVKNKVIYYLVLWRGYPKSQATWQKRSELIKDVPNLIKSFDEKL